MTRRTYVFIIKLLIACAVTFALCYWITSLWADVGWYAECALHKFFHWTRPVSNVP